MPIGLLPILGIGAGSAAVSKRIQNRKMQAAKNAFSKKYPLLDDVSSMESSIANAEQELAAIKGASPKNAAQRRSQSLNASTLSRWIITMKDQARDLKAQISVASSSSATMPSLPAQPVTSSGPAPVVAGQEVQAGENLASPTAKKGVNWFVIGGVLVGGFLIYKLLKK